MIEPIGTLFSNLLSELRGQAERTRTAARALCEAAWDYQRAVWLFASAHQYGVARAVRDVADVESRAVEKMDAASREFTKDYDWPENLRKIFTKEIQQINLETANVKAFSMTGQYDDMKRSAQGIEDACERIRAAAKPYTLGPWRRVRDLHTVTTLSPRPSPSAAEKGWWEVWWGHSIILIVTSVIAGLVIWGITRHYDKSASSTAVQHPKAPVQEDGKPVNISGIVVDGDTNQGIGQALITLAGRTEQYVTEDSGNFTIDLPPDSHKRVRLRVSKTGFQPFDTSVEPPVDNLVLPLHKQQ